MNVLSVIALSAHIPLEIYILKPIESVIDILGWSNFQQKLLNALCTTDCLSVSYLFRKQLINRL